MPSNHTPNYQLNQWEADDRILRTDFNADNAKIDAAIKAVDAKADGKASVSALSALQTAVNGKGNCRIATGSYTGTGTFGAGAPNVLNFSFKPAAVIISAAGWLAVLLAGTTAGKNFGGTVNASWSVTWSGNSVSWYATSASYANFSSCDLGAGHQMNGTDTVYRYIAFGK